MNRKLTVLIIFLACWLPLQSFAAALLHCHALELASADPVVTLDSDLAASSSSALIDCHGETPIRSEIRQLDVDAQANPALTHDHVSTVEHAQNDFCVHCAADCHALQILVLADSAQSYVQSPENLKSSNTPAALSQILENPQRPPKA